MFDDLTGDLVQRLATVDLAALRTLHHRVVDAEAVLRGVIRERERIVRRDERLRSHGLSVIGADG